jgi:hypothetical protein
MSNDDQRLLRCEMPDVNDLDYHHANGFDWIPNSSTIRPSAAVAQQKLVGMTSISSSWFSFDDYILCKVFGKEHEVYENRLFRVKNSSSSTEESKFDLVSASDRVFVPNKYPYNVSGNHWVLWYGCRDRVHSSEEINEHIQIELTKITSKYDDVLFDYIWYVNPKMSIPEFFHVHVFWQTFSTD